MKRVIILGGSGYVGQHLIQKWVANMDNVEFYTVSRSGKPKTILPKVQEAKVEWIKGDACEIESFYDSLPDSADVVIDLVGTASGKSQAEFDRANAEPVHTMVEIMKRKRVQRGIYVSGVIGMPGTMKEFISSKKHGEEIARDSGFDIRIIQPSLIYGDREGVGGMVAMMKFAGMFCKKMKPITVDKLSLKIIEQTLISSDIS